MLPDEVHPAVGGLGGADEELERGDRATLDPEKPASVSSLPSAFSLLPIAHGLYCLLPITHCPLPIVTAPDV